MGEWGQSVPIFRFWHRPNDHRGASRLPHRARRAPFMAPKPKKGKGDGGKVSSAPPPMEAVDPGAEPEVSAGAREVLERELAIGRLKSQLGEFQDATGALEVQVESLRDAVRIEKGDALDVHAFLSLELVKAERLVGQIAGAVSEETGCVEKQTVEIETRLRDARAASERATSAIEKQLTAHDLEAERQRLRETERNDLLAAIGTVSETLASESKARRVELTALEGDALSEKAHLAKAHELAISDKTSQLTRRTDEQLVVTTKRSIAENERRFADLAKQSVAVERGMWRHERAIGEKQRAFAERDASRECNDAAKQRTGVILRRIERCKRDICAVERDRREFAKKAKDTLKDLNFAAFTATTTARDVRSAKKAFERLEMAKDDALALVEALRKKVEAERAETALANATLAETAGQAVDSLSSCVSALAEVLREACSVAGSTLFALTHEDASAEVRLATLDIATELMQQRARQLRVEHPSSVGDIYPPKNGQTGDGDGTGDWETVLAKKTIPGDAARVLSGAAASPRAQNLPSIPSFESRMASWCGS